MHNYRGGHQEDLTEVILGEKVPMDVPFFGGMDGFKCVGGGQLLCFHQIMHLALLDVQQITTVYDFVSQFTMQGVSMGVYVCGYRDLYDAGVTDSRFFR
jgi:hypothetical protein